MYISYSMLYFLSLTRKLVSKNVSYIYELSSFSYSKTSFEAYMLHFMPCFLSLTRKIVLRDVYVALYGLFVFTGSWLFLWRSRIGFLRKEQSQCLRTVAGAYRATLVRSLETETFVPPLVLYLNDNSKGGPEWDSSSVTAAQLYSGTADAITSWIHATSIQQRDN